MVLSIPRSSHDSDQLWPDCLIWQASGGYSSAGKPRHGVGGTHIFARAIAPPLDLDPAFGKSLGSDHDLPWNADQIGSGKLCSGVLISVVVEDVVAFCGQNAVKSLFNTIALFSALHQ